ncbi:RHS repeat-associated core domain-containing protein [Agromyces sp. PvR057]|uniref:RHS repeat-associated core domain-containing protein n=1 Tax=Agromyces sp. PvR057 TaxID=3156403 RepID=UPI003394E189
MNEVRLRERLMLTVAGVLVVVLGVDPGMLGVASSSAAQAAASGVIDESRAQNLAAAEASLGMEVPAASVPLTGPGEDPAAQAVPLELPSTLPSAAETTVDLPRGEQTTGTGAAVPLELGGMSVTVAPVEGEAAPERVSVKVLDQASTEQAGVTGVLLEVTDASETPATGDQLVELSVAYAAFAGIGGGDWASRLQAVWVPDCASSEESSSECRPVPLQSTRDETAQTVTVTVPVNSNTSVSGSAPAMLRGTTTAAASNSSSGGSVGIGSGVAGPLGDWSATSLALSSTWGTSGATGAFTWAYPMRVPKVPAGPSPAVSLSYTSAVSDGRIASTNNQSGLIGEGFDIGGSFIERTYTSCSKDETAGANNIDLSAPDLCWGTENATLSLNGGGSDLVKDKTTGTWHPKQDDGTRIEQVPTGGAKGEYWKVTTTDGTQYFFGQQADAASAWTVPVFGNHAGEPGHASAFKDSSTEQVWRWNLDRVVDPSGNTAAYFYTTESNKYRPFYGDTAMSYISGGYLSRVEYGTHADDGVSNAPAKVEFTNTPRCITDLAVPDSWCSSGQSSTTGFHWPDTPVDLICETATACETYAPTFFNRTRLSKVSTSVSDGSNYVPVDSWTLSQRFVPQGDGIGLEYATGIMLRLEAVTHTGQGGSRADVTLPAVKFSYTALKNRVEVADTGADGLWRHRVTSVRTESGGRVSVNYTTRCVDGLTADPATNSNLCFPVKWNDGTPRTDYFYKYVVDTVVEGDSSLEANSPELITGSLAVVTRYDYTGAAWKWVKPDSPLIDDADKTYSEFRGAKQVTTISGDGSTPQTRTVTSYYRGTGETLTSPIASIGSVVDHDRLAGEVFSSTQLNGSTKVSETVSTFGDPVTVATSAHDSGYLSTRIPSESVDVVTYRASGAEEHHTRTTTKFNALSQPTSVDDRGDTTTATDNVCTTTTYAHDADQTLAGKHLVALPSDLETVAKACDEQPQRPADVITASKLSYDSSGRPTKVEAIDPNDGDGYITASTTKYDTRGRGTETADATGQKVTTAFTASPGGLVAETTTTNPLGHINSTKFDPILGAPIRSTDANGRATHGTYDALGRLSTVTYPQHSDAGPPSLEYDYTVQANGLNAVITKTISADGKSQHASAALYDGLMRPFQTQQQGRGSGYPDLGRMVAHTRYDSAGRVIEQTEPWWVEDDVSAKPEVKPADTSGHTTYEYDAAGRQTAQIFWVGTDSSLVHEKWRTVTSYDGATTWQIPPMGATPTTTTVDPRGRTVELTQYHRDPDTNIAATTQTELNKLEKSTTTYGYDHAGSLNRMVTNNVEWSYEHDWAGRQISATDPDAGQTSSTYDVLGRVSTRTNGNGQTLGYTYDALGRTTSIRDGSPAGSIRASWEYDTVLKGVLTKSTRFAGGQAYTTRTDGWDTAYRPTSTTLELPNTGVFANLQSRTITTRMDYTVDGQAAKITYPAVVDSRGKMILGAEAVTTVYDAASSMPSWMSGGFGWGVYVAASRFAADGRPLLADLGNTYGSVVSYRYEDGTKRLSGISVDRERIDGTELNLAYAYDQAGNVTNIADAPTSPKLSGAAFKDTQCFNYDGLTRLQTAWTPTDGNCTQAPAAGAMGGAAPYWTGFTYDVLGNRTEQTSTTQNGTAKTTTYAYGVGAAGPHAVTSATVDGVAATYTYDDAGNRVTAKTGGVTTGYTWDVEGELTTTGDTSNVYDADGNRIVRTDANGTTVYAGGQEIRIKTNGTVEATRYYTFSGQTVAVRTDRGLGNGVTSLVADHHGTPVAAIPNGGHPAKTAISRLYTTPFGATRGASDASTVPGDTQFLGKTRDGTTGLTLLGARYYDETIGGFISVDPVLDLTDPQQWNAYAYSGNNPLTYSDASGLLMVGPTDGSTYNPRTKKVTTNTINSSSADAIRDSVAARLAAVVESFDSACSRLSASTTLAACGSQRDFKRDLRYIGETARATSLSALEMVGTYPLAGGVGLFWRGIATGSTRGGTAGTRLVSAVEGESTRVVASQSIRQRGPVLSGALDRKSGEIFFGQNTGVPTPLNSNMKAAIDAFPGPAAAGKGTPGTHAEINAINQGLFARPGSTISDFVLYSVRLRGAQQGSQIMMCQNCAGILNGAEDIFR